MLVVIEVEDWSDNNADLLRELAVIQESHDDIVSDPRFDPEDLGDETLRLKTDLVGLDVARIVGTLRQVDAATPGTRYAIDKLES